jgi:DnaJ-domain-containing protein 1
MSNAATRWRAAVLGIAERLNDMDYFTLLNLEQSADDPTVRKAFRSLATHYHPDRLGQTNDRVLHDSVSAIYRRITEAYSVLRDPQRRSDYCAGLEQGIVRFDADLAERRRYAEREAAIPGKTPAGRTHYEAAQTALRDGNTAAAKAEIRAALLYERDCEGFLELRDQIESTEVKS